jgi:ketosteroid isomerase-like protein
VTGDESEVRTALTSWYASMTAHDLAAVGAALTDTFLLIEHDEMADRAELLGMLSGAPNDSLDAHLSDFQVSVMGDVAWSTHRNREMYTPSGGETQELFFLETVVLVRRGGRWLIDRYHATRLSPVA